MYFKFYALFNIIFEYIWFTESSYPIKYGNDENLSSVKM